MNTVQKKKATAKKRATWGDADARRRDILGAAQSLIDEHGYARLNTRDIARRAGVSLGTLYVYFETKEEIFLTLYARRLTRFCDEARAVAASSRDLGQLFRGVGRAYLDFYNTHGRHLNLWSLLTDETKLSKTARELSSGLQQLVTGLMAELDVALHRIAERQRRPVERHPLLMPFLWITLNGLAEHFSGPRRQVAPYDFDDMAEFIARVLGRALAERAS
jgi:AcrR family transcriptional regulator